MSHETRSRHAPVGCANGLAGSAAAIGAENGEAQHPATWHTLHRFDAAIIIGTLVVLGFSTWGHLPDGVCFGDAGELQLASTVLGIMHPPGYAVLTTIGFLITRVPGLDPALLITIGSWACGLAALGICMLTQVRLGVHAAIAALVAMVVAANPRIWAGILTPEVYVPSALLLIVSAYQLIKLSITGQQRHLVWAAFFYGSAASIRPPVALAFPFFLVGWLLIRRSRQWEWRRSLRGLAVVLTVGLAPTVYSLAYYWVRDTPSNPYNYLDRYNVVARELPESTDGPGAKWTRLTWLVTATQFSDHFGTTWKRMRTKLRWLQDQILFARPVSLAIVAAFVVMGGGMLLFRNPVAGLLLLGMIVHSVTFVTLYRMHGPAADIVPLLLAGAVLAGVGGSPVLSIRSRGLVHWMAIIAACGTAAWTLHDAPNRAGPAHASEAEAFLNDLDITTLPQSTVILAGWGVPVPIWFAQTIRQQRPDVVVLSAPAWRWEELIADRTERTILLEHQMVRLPHHSIQPFRNLYRAVEVRPPGGLVRPVDRGSDEER